ncbi:MAG: hypothetical protein BRC29_02610 [Nanohaloarchaea archaeon SW_7_43_1]|nr:MAG: hypothetical protein BRC29_02610 [Nanohaloarchaea archaeon SW_7_43_1]
MVGAGLFYAVHTAQMCTQSATTQYRIAENTKTGEIVHKSFSANGDPDCRSDDWNEFPNHYRTNLSQSEIQEYCSENPEKRRCELRRKFD